MGQPPEMSPQITRVIYAGTPDFAVPALAALIESGYQVVAVYTQPDRPAGRGRKLQISPVKQLALQHDLTVEQPQSLRCEHEQQKLQNYRADLMVVAAFGQILPPEVLAAPTYGCLNIHASLLPRWRGAAPIQRAIEQGDATSGVTIMQMDEGLDTGDMLYQLECDIKIETTATQLHDMLAELGTQALMHTLEKLQSDDLSPQVQDEHASCYAAKITKSEAVLDWQQPALVLHRKICAFNGWPVAQTRLKDEVLRVWESSVTETSSTASAGQVIACKNTLEVATGDGVLRLLKVQSPGKKAMSAEDFLNSREIMAGTQLG